MYVLPALLLIPCMVNCYELGCHTPVYFTPLANCQRAEESVGFRDS